MVVVPAFAEDTRTVADYSTTDEPIVARIFIPLLMSTWGQFQDWSEAANMVGLTLTAHTRWSQISARAVSGKRADMGQPQMGTIDVRTVSKLLSALAPRASSGSSTRFALWTGYAGEMTDELEHQVTALPKGAGNYLGDGSYGIKVDDLSWASTRSLESGTHFPAAVWCPDLTFVLSCPIYQDSCFLTCDQATLARLQALGVEAFAIDRGAPVPSEGD